MAEQRFSVPSGPTKTAATQRTSQRAEASNRHSAMREQLKIGGVGLRELFLPLLGNWTGVEQQAASAWAPATTARAMIVFKLDVVDQVVVQDYRQVRADRAEFSGHGVFMIDRAVGNSPAQQEPVLWWFFDSEGYPPEPAHGGWHDGELILEKVTPRGIAEHRFAVADGQLSYRIRVQLGQATELQDFLRGTYRRFSGH
jgi:hypothetical protein